jgi:hypothetical protein
VAEILAYAEGKLPLTGRNACSAASKKTAATAGLECNIAGMRNPGCRVVLVSVGLFVVRYTVLGSGYRAVSPVFWKSLLVVDSSGGLPALCQKTAELESPAPCFPPACDA